MSGGAKDKLEFYFGLLVRRPPFGGAAENNPHNASRYTNDNQRNLHRNTLYRMLFRKHK